MVAQWRRKGIRQRAEKRGKWWWGVCWVAVPRRAQVFSGRQLPKGGGPEWEALSGSKTIKGMRAVQQARGHDG